MSYNYYDKHYTIYNDGSYSYKKRNYDGSTAYRCRDGSKITYTPATVYYNNNYRHYYNYHK